MLLTEDFIEQLLYENESNSFDAKSEQYKFATEDEKSELLKDILAFSNSHRRTDAYILIGIEERKPPPHLPIGITKHLDDAQLQQFVNSKTQRIVTFSYSTLGYKGKSIGIIHIPLQERPIYLKKNFGKLRKDVVYIRRGSATGEASPDEIASMRKVPIDVKPEPKLHLKFSGSKTTQTFKINKSNQLELLFDEYKHIKKEYPFLEISEPTFDFSMEDRLVQLKSLMKQIKENREELYKDYLKKWMLKYNFYFLYKIGYKKLLERCFPISLILANNGHTPAEDVEVLLHFPGTLSLLKKEALINKEPKKPQDPMPESVFTVNYLSNRLRPNLNHYYNYTPKNYTPKSFFTQNSTNLDGDLNIKKTDGYEVNVTYTRIKHNKSYNLETIYVIPDWYLLSSRFIIKHSTLAANIPNKIDGELFVEFEFS